MSVRRLFCFGECGRTGEEIEEEKSDDPTSLNYLNGLCLVEIFVNLPFKDKFKLMRVCKRWRALMSLAFRNSRKLSLGCLYGEYEWRIDSGPGRFKCGSHILRSVLNFLPNHFNSVSFPRGEGLAELSTSDLRLLVSKCPNLKILDLSCTTVPEEGVLALEGKLKKLEALMIPVYAEVEDNWGKVLATTSNLKHLNFNGSKFTGSCLNRLRHVQTVQSVNFNSMKNLQHQYLEEFLQSHPNLKKFRLSYGSAPPPFLPDLCLNLSVLQLDCSRCSRWDSSNDPQFLTRWFPRLTQLRELYVYLNDYFDNAALQSVCENCVQLEVLNMRNTTISANHLLCVRRLKNLKILDIRDIRGCQDVTDAILISLTEGCGANIEELSTGGLVNITDLGLIRLAANCPKLSEFDIDCSPRVTTEGLREFLDLITSHPHWESRPTKKFFLGGENVQTSKLNLRKWGGRVITQSRVPFAARRLMNIQSFSRDSIQQDSWISSLFSP